MEVISDYFVHDHANKNKKTRRNTEKKKKRLTHLSTGVFPAPTTVTAGHIKTVHALTEKHR